MDGLVRLCLLNAVIFVGTGLYLPFFPVWLESRGLDAAAIGLVLSVPMVVRILATPFITGLADRHLPASVLLTIVNAGLLAAYALLTLVDGLAAIMAVMVLVGLAMAPLVPLTDVTTTAYLRGRQGLSYGGIRLWGSVAFLVTNLVGGALLTVMKADAFVWLLAAVAGLGAVVALAAPAGGQEVAADHRRAVADAVRRQRMALLALVAAAASVQASHGMIYAFGTLHWRGQGLSGNAIGLLWSLGVLAEIVLFARVGPLVGTVGRGLAFVGLGGGSALVRFALMALDPGFAATLALQLLHGLSFGATHLGTIAALTGLAPPGARARWQGILTACNAGAMAAATMASGPLYGSFGAGGYAAMAGLGALGMLFAFLALRGTSQPQSSGEGGATVLPS
ncbi:MAG: MFS transporter [Pseudomonadota bacterium]|jgi:Nucleoside H+ symporter.